MYNIKKLLLLLAVVACILSFNVRGNCDQCKKVLDEYNKLVHEYINVTKELRAHVKDNVDYSGKLRKLHGD